VHIFCSHLAVRLRETFFNEQTFGSRRSGSCYWRMEYSNNARDLFVRAFRGLRVSTREPRRNAIRAERYCNVFFLCVCGGGAQFPPLPPGVDRTRKFRSKESGEPPSEHLSRLQIECKCNSLPLKTFPQVANNLTKLWIKCI